MRIACLIVDLIQHEMFCLCRPTITLHQSRSRPSNRTWAHMACMGLPSCQVWMWYLKYCPRYCKFKSSQVWDALMTLNESQGQRTDNIIYVCSWTILAANRMGIAWILSEIIKRLFFNDYITSVWPWIKVKVNIINTWCISMSEAVTVWRLMMMTSIASEDSIAFEGHTQTQTDRQTDSGRLR